MKNPKYHHTKLSSNRTLTTGSMVKMYTSDSWIHSALKPSAYVSALISYNEGGNAVLGA